MEGTIQVGLVVQVNKFAKRELSCRQPGVSKQYELPLTLQEHARWQHTVVAKEKKKLERKLAELVQKLEVLRDEHRKSTAAVGSLRSDLLSDLAGALKQRSEAVNELAASASEIAELKTKIEKLEADRVKSAAAAAASASNSTAAQQGSNLPGPVETLKVCMQI